MNVANPSGCMNVDPPRPRLNVKKAALLLRPKKRGTPIPSTTPAPLPLPVTPILMTVMLVVNLAYVVHEWNGDIPDYTHPLALIEYKRSADEQPDVIRIREGGEWIAIPGQCMGGRKE